MNKDDIKAIYDLAFEDLKTNEWSKAYVDRTDPENKPRLKFGDVRGGRAWWRRATGITYLISLPNWLAVDDLDDRFVIWYVTHEVCHCIYHDHLSLFKRLEQSIMAKWGVTIEYARAYPKRLMGDNGEVIYESARERYKRGISRSPFIKGQERKNV